MEELEYYFKQLKNFFRYHWQGIKNLFIYAPLIYNTREFDYSYSLILLEFKLKRLGDYIEKHKRFVGYDFVVRDIKLAVRLLNRMREDYYGVEYLNYYKSTISFVPYNDKGSMMMVEENIVHTFDEYFKLYPRIYRQVLKGTGVVFQGLDDKTLAMNIAHINEQRCKDLFWKILTNKIERWWD